MGVYSRYIFYAINHLMFKLNQNFLYAFQCNQQLNWSSPTIEGDMNVMLLLAPGPATKSQLTPTKPYILAAICNYINLVTWTTSLITIQLLIQEPYIYYQLVLPQSYHYLGESLCMKRPYPCWFKSEQTHLNTPELAIQYQPIRIIASLALSNHSLKCDNLTGQLHG